MIKARTLVLGILVVIAVPTIAWGDAASDLKAELECRALTSRGDACSEYTWSRGSEVEKGEKCPSVMPYRSGGSKIDPDTGHTVFFIDPPDPSAEPRVATNCRCNRKAYQDFGVVERIKYHRCK